jgi:hypothetical protein
VTLTIALTNCAPNGNRKATGNNDLTITKKTTARAMQLTMRR